MLCLRNAIYEINYYQESIAQNASLIVIYNQFEIILHCFKRRDEL